MYNYDSKDKVETIDRAKGDELFSVPVKAGKRIYYFDVKSTRNDDYYVTVTESRKRQLNDGSFVIDKHKIHLYKEDFEKFAVGLEQAIAFIKEHKPQQDESFVAISQDIPSKEEFFKGF